MDATDGLTPETNLPHLPRWFTATVVKVASPNVPLHSVASGDVQFGVPAFLVTFKGFTKRYDKWYPVSCEEVQPSGSCREAGRISLRLKKEVKEKEKEAKRLEAEKAAAAVAVVPMVVETTVSKSGRKIKATAPPPPKAAKKPRTEAKNAADLLPADQRTSWICTECSEIECASDPDAPLIICEGSCERPFHLKCVEGMTEVPEGEWICADCTKGSHACVVCAEYGVDGVEGGVVKCRKGDCGLFYHESCLGLYNANMDEKQIAENEARAQEGDETYRPVKFTCPAHMCWTCGDIDERIGSNAAFQSKTVSHISPLFSFFLSLTLPPFLSLSLILQGPMYRCMVCPNAFHIDCIPPLANFHELAVLCHEHASTHSLPQMTSDMSVMKNSKKGKDGDKRKKVVQGWRGSSDIVPVTIPDKFIDGFSFPDMVLPGNFHLGFSQFRTYELDNMSFKMSLNIHDEVYSKPPAYHHISVPKYVGESVDGVEGEGKVSSRREEAVKAQPSRFSFLAWFYWSSLLSFLWPPAHFHRSS